MPRKKRQEGRRAPNGASSIYQGNDGRWHGRVTMGVGDDGRTDRRHVQASTEKEVTAKVRQLERERDSGTARKPGRPPTVAEWLTRWVEEIAALTVRYRTLTGYRTAVYKHLVPGLGAHRIDRVEPEHFEKLYARMVKAGLKPATAHQVHRTARTAFGEAYRRGLVGRNVVELAKSPRLDDDEEVEPFEIEDIKRVITAALGRRNGVRYVLALATGCRQGECLGFKWDRLDRRTRVLRVRRGLQRHTWQHGCENPHECGAKYHKRQPCPTGCTRHKKCPPPCSPDCERHAANCPKRHGGGLVEVEVKSKAGRRAVVLPDELFDLLMVHERAQLREREHAGTVWCDDGWMFAQPTGRPLDPRRDLEEWKSILAEAGVRDARLHDARHTAATVLALLGVPPRVAMSVMGWSEPAMLIRYQHVTDAMRQDVADKVGGYLWGTETPSGDP